MRIACLGWGSLIWDPRDLPIEREWFLDGPFAPVEFRRKSSDGRITLVIDPEAASVRVLWAHMLPADLPAAKEALRRREGLTSREWERDIRAWKSGHTAPDTIPDLPIWAKAHGLDAAIWTALGPRLDDAASPSADQVIDYLSGLTGPAKDAAERYIRCAPRQIDTEYRRKIEAALGWSHRPC